MKLLLVGPVGSGKGTQAAIISKNYGIPHISTGEIFRQHMQNKTELGLKAKEYINAGQLVPEELTFSIVKDRLSKDDCKNGFILDGYPRTMEQVKNLETITSLDKVILIHLDEEEIIRRLSSRRMCSNCKQPTSTDWLKDGKCEKCGFICFCSCFKEAIEGCRKGKIITERKIFQKKVWKKDVPPVFLQKNTIF